MSYRVEKLNELLRSELAVMINKEGFLKNGLITITKVKCSSDLHLAKVYVSILPEGLTGTALKKIRNHNKFFARELGKKLKLKYIPKINFIVDGAEKYVAQIEETINKINQEKNEG